MGTRNISARRGKRGRPQNQKLPRRPKPVQASLTVTELGHQGDGIAPGPDGSGQVYVPFTLAGETVEAEIRGDRGTAMQIVTPSPDRVRPPCPHFGPEGSGCGGCQLQHMALPVLLAWKELQIRRALARRGIDDVPLRPAIAIGPGTRRRAAFQADPKTGRLGFAQRHSHRLVEIGPCPILDPALEAALPQLKDAAHLAEAESLYVFASPQGLAVDLDVEISDPLRLADLAALAGQADFAELTANGAFIAQRRPPRLTFGTTPVTVPPRSFLQATAAGEAALAQAAREAVTGASGVADLFCGLGTFALSLPQDQASLAMDRAGPAVAALQRAAPHLTVARRDLDRRPLTAKELAPFDGVVIDPPRAGAAAQMAELAKSSVWQLAALSCNPASFARDARILIGGGYRLNWVQLVDQFVWSAHIELAASFSRD